MRAKCKLPSLYVLFGFYFLGSILFDFLDKYSKLGGSNASFAFNFRIIAISFLIITLFRLKNLQIIWLMCPIIIMPIMGFALDSNNFYYTRDLYIIFKLSIATCFLIFIFEILKKYKPDDINDFFYVIVSIFSFNIFFCLLGLTYGISFFKMDQAIYREGFTGLLPFSGNEVNYFYLSVMYYLTLRFKISNQIGDNKLTLWFVYYSYFSMAMLSGLKGSMIVALLSFMILFPKTMIFIVTLLIFTFQYIGINEYGLYLVSKYHHSDFINFLTSGRYERLIGNFTLQDNFGSIIFGEGKLVNFEMEPFTTLQSFGVLGSLTFVPWIYYSYYFGSRDMSCAFFWISLVALNIVAGHLHYSMFAVPWVAFATIAISSFKWEKQSNG